MISAGYIKIEKNASSDYKIFYDLFFSQLPSTKEVFLIKMPI